MGMHTIFSKYMCNKLAACQLLLAPMWGRGRHFTRRPKKTHQKLHFSRFNRVVTASAGRVAGMKLFREKPALGRFSPLAIPVGKAICLSLFIFLSHLRKFSFTWTLLTAFSIRPFLFARGNDYLFLRLASNHFHGHHQGNTFRSYQLSPSVA